MKWISTLIMLLGFIIAIVGVLQTKAIPTPKKKYTYVDLDIGNSGFGVAIIFLGIFCIGLGVLGFFLAKFKGCISTTLFNTFAGLFALILLILGALMGGFVSDKLFQKIKRHSCKNSQIVFDEYVAAVDKSVCSVDCPCP